MDHKLIFKEIKIALKETSRYILSHHQPEEYYKCYSLTILDQKIHVCSRCLGIYFGILMGIGIFPIDILNSRSFYLLIAILPLFTLIDWSVSAFKIHKSYNTVRTGFGALLGISYSIGLIIFFKTFPNYYIIVVGLVYALISLLLLRKQRELEYQHLRKKQPY